MKPNGGEEEMKRIKGKVIEVYIPEEYKNGNLLDVMDRTNIGFRVLTEEGIKEVEEEQTESNVEIRKDDRVLIIEQTIDGHDFVDIVAYGGEEDE